MHVNVAAVKGPYGKTRIKANLFYFSCIALFGFFFLNELGTWRSNGNIISDCEVIMHNCRSHQVLPAGVTGCWDLTFAQIQSGNFLSQT